MAEDQLGCVLDLEVATFVCRWQILGKYFFILVYFGFAFVKLVG